MFEEQKEQSPHVDNSLAGKNDLQLDRFYRQEVYRKISTLETALNHIDNNGHFDENIKTILNSCMQIMDLGMIHGYEGVEAIAETMFAAARFCAWQGAGSLDEVRQKLFAAVETLKQVVDLTDPKEARKLIDKARVDMDFRIDDLLPHEEEAEEDIWSEPLRSKAASLKAENGKFDIHDYASTAGDRENGTYQNGFKEPDLDEEKVAENFESFDFLQEEKKAQPDYIKAFEEAEIEVVEAALDEILIRKVHEALDLMNEALENIEQENEVNLAIQDIKSACNQLKDLSYELQLQPLSNIIFPMGKLATDYLENEADRPRAMQLLREGLQAIQQFVDQKKIATSQLKSLTLELESFETGTMLPKQEEANRTNDFLIGDEEPDIPEPPRLPMIVRLKRFFGMY